MNTKRIITAILLALVCVAAQAAGKKAVTAEAILSSLRSNFTSAPSVDVVFTINTGNGPLHGSAIIAADKYMLSTPELKVWYDGKTQWAQLQSTKEVNITTPDADERMASNPFAILTAGKSAYTARRLPDDNGRYVVRLTPTDNTSVVEAFTIYVKPADKWPSAIVIDFEDGRKVSLVIDSISKGKARAAAVFRYDKSRYPAFEIIDLR